jgi:hypothetical protein
MRLGGNHIAGHKSKNLNLQKARRLKISLFSLKR